MTKMTLRCIMEEAMPESYRFKVHECHRTTTVTIGLDRRLKPNFGGIVSLLDYMVQKHKPAGVTVNYRLLRWWECWFDRQQWKDNA